MVILRHLLNCSSKVVCCIRSGRKDVRPLCPGAVLCTRDRGCQSSIWRLLETESWAPPPETLIQGSGLGLSICISDTCATLSVDPAGWDHMPRNTALEIPGFKGHYRVFLGSQITRDSDCSHKIKRRLLLGRKACPPYTAY